MTKIFLAQAEANRAINENWLHFFSGMHFADLEQQQGAFFGSIFGTLNHILLGDRIWLGRISGEAFDFDTLGDQICPTLETLVIERAKTDAALIALTGEKETFAREIDYINTEGTRFRQPLDQILTHLFAHQHHHRGQISQMCHQRGIPIPDGGTIAYTRRQDR